MTKTLIRISVAAMAFVLAITFLAAIPAAPEVSAASGGKPVFTITTDSTAADTGSRVVVSMAVDNDTPEVITSFLGELRFDTRFFRYEGFEDQISMDGCVDVVATASSNGKLSFVYTGKDLTNSRINSGDSVVFIKFIFTVATNYDTTGQFFIGTINDCYYDEVNLGIIDCKAPSITIRSTTTPLQTQASAAPSNLSGDARLSSLTVEGCTLSPAFNSEFVAYSAVVPYETSNVRIDAVTSSSGAIPSGLGMKDLAVGINNFTVTVLAENGTMKEYGIVITRLEPTVSSESTTLSTLPEQTTTPTETTTQPTLIAPTTFSGSTTIEEKEDEVSDDILQVVGIVFGEIALFFFGFLSGFFVDKNLRRKGERRDDYDDEYDEDEYQPAGTIYAPGEQIYPESGYIDPNYQMQQQFQEPPLVDPNLIPYNQLLQQPMEPQMGQINQMGQPQMNPQMGQFGEHPVYPPEGNFDGGFDGNYPGGPYYN